MRQTDAVPPTYAERNDMATQQFERTDRIGSEMMREVERVIREEVRDPRTDCIFSITHADVTRDLRYAKIYVSILEEDKRVPMMKALKSAAGFIRHAVGQRIQLRYTPELLFQLDTSIEYGVHIAEVLNQINKESNQEA
jgi:ribosome-binding factor A